MKQRRKFVLGGAVVAGLAAFTLAAAQPAFSGPCRGKSPEAYEQHQTARAQHMEQRLTRMKERLGITAAQEPAWQRFVQAMQENRGAEIARKGSAPESLPERLDRRVEMAEQHLERVKARGQATRELYSQLTPEQQQKADSLMGKRKRFF